jgi:HEXXH motif-containing protein
MNLRPHRMPLNLFDALAKGGGGPEAVRVLAAAQYSKHLLLLRGVLATARTAGHGQARLAHHGYGLLADAQRHDPAAADAVIRNPSVGAWALHTLRALRGGPAMSGAEPAGLCAVAAAAAIRARMSAEIEVSPIGGVVMLPSLGAAAVAGGSATVRSALSGAVVLSARGQVDIPADPHQDALGWQALRRFRTGSFEVLINDLDPFRMPATVDVAPRLDTADLDRWDVAFHEAWSLLTGHHPELAAEMVDAIRVIVPLTAPPRGQVSSSSGENFGAIALSEPPDPRTFAVTLAHEVQHLKLSALLDIVSLTRPDDGRRFYAPWRDDPRPVSGLLQGAYAYLGVSGFWRRQRHLDHGAARIRAQAEFARWREAAASVVETLRASGLLTPAGLDFVDGMARALGPWQHEPVPAEALTLARRQAGQHLADWRAANEPIRA